MPPSEHHEQVLDLIARLTRRENQILERLVGGQSMSSISASLSLSLEETTQAKQELMDKLSARTTADLVRIGIYASTSSRN